jgi:hypothetical protein
MAVIKTNLAADIPLELREADELLMHYGRWARDRRRLHRCGSAEGRYVSPPNDDDRVPGEIVMPTPLAMVCQRALTWVPERERVVLAVLYIPRKVPAEVQLRRLRISPRMSQERHLLGLRIWWNKVRVNR